MRLRGCDHRALLLIFSAVQNLQSLALFSGFAGMAASAALQAPVLPHVLPPLLAAGGITQLLLLRFPMPRALRGGLAAIPAAGALTLAWVALAGGFWPAAIQEGLLGALLLLVGWSGGAGRQEVAARRWVGQPWSWLLPLALLVAMGVWMLRTGFLTEAIPWAVAALVAVLGRRLTLPEAPGGEVTSDELTVAEQDRLLEAWNWVVLLATVAMAGQGSYSAAQLRGVLLTVAVAVYFTAQYLFLGPGAVRRRGWLHMAFLVVGLLFLVSSNGTSGKYLVTFVAFSPPVAAWARGRRTGYAMLAVSLALVVLGWRHRVAGGLVLQTPAWADLVMQLLIVLFVGLVGIALAGVFVSAIQRMRASQAEAAAVQRALARSEARLSSLIGISPNAAIVIDENQRIILFNQMAERVFGYTQDEAVGQPLDILLPPESAERHRRFVAGFKHAPVSQLTIPERRELVGRRKSGELFPVEVAIARVSVDGETVFMAVALDVTERRETQRRLEESEERFRSAFEHAPIGVALLDAELRLTQVNRSLCAMLGHTAEELIGRSVASFCLNGEPRPEQMAPLLTGEEVALRLEGQWQHRDGRTVWVAQSYSLMRTRRDEVSYVLQVQDISEQKGYEAELVRLALFDPLTELANRRHFREVLDRELEACRRTGRGGALFFLDLDMFKYVNDSLGHQVGDEVLRQAGNLLRRTFRPTDTVARLGGDEFAVLLPGTTTEEAVRMAEGLLGAIRFTPIAVGGTVVTITASLGVAVYPEHGMTAEELLSKGDMALYEAKEKGRNTWALFTPDGAWQREMAARLAWERRIRTALEHDLFVLHYQPILDLARNAVTHHEVLVRMVGENGALIYPGDFLGMAERLNLVPQIDRWVVARTIQKMGQFRRGGRQPILGVNLSGKTLADPELPALIRSELEAAQLEPSRLVLEITETAAIGDLAEAERFIREMKALGCRFALDDVGAGFASLYFLKRLPVDYIKIDGAFIRNLAHDTADQLLVRAMAMVSRELGKRTVAEFVDSPATLKLVREYGIDYAQGYMIGRPGPDLDLDPFTPALLGQ